MLAATLLGIFFIPASFVLVERLGAKRGKHAPVPDAAAHGPAAPTQGAHVNIALRLAAPALVAIAAMIASERDAHALGPVDVEIGARVGVATNPDSKGPNPFGLGLGGRAGVSIFHIYGGLSAIHYFGSSSDIPTPAGTISSSYSSTLLGVEAGYSITAIPHLTLRPQLGVGNASFSFGELSQSHLYLEPGVVGLVKFGLLYVGADLNLLAIPGIDRGAGDTKTYTAFTVHGQVGIQF